MSNDKCYEIVNLTDKPVWLYDVKELEETDYGYVLSNYAVIPKLMIVPTGVIARIDREERHTGSINVHGERIREASINETMAINLPDEKDGVLLIVLPEIIDYVLLKQIKRSDLRLPIYPVHDKTGKFVGYAGLGIIH